MRASVVSGVAVAAAAAIETDGFATAEGDVRQATHDRRELLPLVAVVVVVVFLRDHTTL